MSAVENLRTYGRRPFRLAVIHGGPGARGYMAPVAQELSEDWGVLEPLQTAASLEGQVQELRAVLADHATSPVTLIGSSWGAMLSFILAARYPAFVAKLILIGSAVYEARYATAISATRLGRLSAAERRKVEKLSARLDDPGVNDKNAILARLAHLYTVADVYDPLTLNTETLAVQYDINQSVWSEASALRASGELLALGQQIRCPVVAIHGDYDPHPPEGVRKPLTAVLNDFRFILLPRCGHYPWLERQARDAFFDILRREIKKTPPP